MFNPPILNYIGLTIVLSNPGRHDKDRLLAGRVGEWFDDILKQAGTTRFNICIKDLQDPSAYPTNTKVVLLLGSNAQKTITPLLSLNEARGYCYQPLPNNSPIYI